MDLAFNSATTSVNSLAAVSKSNLPFSAVAFVGSPLTPFCVTVLQYSVK